MAVTNIELPAELDDLAVAFGVIADGTLNDDLFGGDFSEILTDPDRRAALLRVAQRLLDEHGGRPAIDDADGTQWIPLVVGESRPGVAPTGLYATVVESAPDSVTVGIGALVAHRPTNGEVSVRLAAQLPIARIAASTTPAMLVGTADGNLEVALDIDVGGSGVAAQPITSSGLDIDAVGVSLTIPTDGSTPGFVVRLAMPPDGDAGDLVLDSREPLGTQAVDIVVDLLRSVAGDAANELGHLLALLGLSDGDGTLPRLDLDRLLSEGRSAVWAWVRSTIGAAGAPEAWLGELAELLGLAAPTGSGSAADPWRVASTVGTTSVGLDLVLDRTGAEPVLSPSFAVRTQQTVGTVPVVASGSIRPLSLALGSTPRLVLDAVGEAGALVGEATGASTILDTDIDGRSIRLGAARFAIAASTLDGIRPVVEALRVRIDTTDYDVLDLTSVDAVLEAAGGVLRGTLDDLLTELGDSAAARAFLALGGVVHPNDRPTWPHLTDPVRLLADPVTTLRDFYAEVLQAGDGDAFAGEIARLFGVTVPTITGSGTELDPWTVPIETTTLATGMDVVVNVAVWSSESPLTLHIGADVRATIPAFGPAGRPPTVAMRVEVARVAVNGEMSATAVPALSVLITTGPLDLEVGELVLAASDFRGGAAWERSTGLAPIVELVDPRIEVADLASVPIPLPHWDATTREFTWGAEPPWDELEPLIGTLLGAVSPTLGDVVNLLGWAGSDGAALSPVVGAGAAEQLRLADLVDDPAGAVVAWLTATARSDQAAGWAREVFSWLADALGGGATAGAGVAGAPWAADLFGELGGGALSVVAALDGPPVLGDALEAVLPESLRELVADGPIAADPSRPTLESIAGMLDGLGSLFPEIAALADGRDAVDGMRSIRSVLGGSDGFVGAGSQHLADAVQRTLDGSSFFSAPADVSLDVHMPDLPSAASIMYVVCQTDGLSAWPGQTPDRLIDLSASSAVVPAAPLDRIAGVGPWFVVLPSATSDTTSLRSALAAAVTSFAPHAASIALVGHGAAGHAASEIAASPPTGVTIGHLVTVATAHQGSPTPWDAAAEDGARLLTGLADLARNELAAAARHDAARVNVLLDVLERRLAAESADLASLVRAPVALPATVALTTVAATITPEALDTFGATLLTSAADALADAGRAAAAAVSTASGIVYGLRRQLAATSPAPGGVRGRLCVSTDIGRIGSDSDGHHVDFELKLDRPGRWLIGGPGASVRCRSAVVHLELALTDTGVEPHLSLSLTEAAALGVSRTSWPIEPSLLNPARLLPEEREIIGALGTAIDDATGALIGLRDLVLATALARLDAESRLVFDLGALETALTTPSSLHGLVDGTARRAAVAGAVRTLVGGTGTGAAIAMNGPMGTTTIDLTTTIVISHDVQAAPAGVGGTIDASFTISGPTAAAPMSATGSVALGVAGAARLVVSGSTGRLPTVSFEAGGHSVDVLPAPDTAGLARLFTGLIPAGIVQAGLDWARESLPPMAEIVDLLGMGAPDEPVRLPLGLTHDPVGWMRGAARMELPDGRLDIARLVRLPQLAIDLLQGSSGGAPLSLTNGLELSVEVGSSGSLDVALGWSTPHVVGFVSCGGTIGFSLGADGSLAPAVATVVDVLDSGGTPLGGLSVSLSPALVGEVRIPLAGSMLAVAFAPLPTGLGDVAGAAQRALPLVLDALTALTVGGAPVGAGLGALGDALGVREGAAGSRRFTAPALTALVEQPDLVPARLIASAADTAAAFVALLDPIVPGSLTSVGGVTAYSLGALSASVDLLATPPIVCIAVSDLTPIPQLAVSGEVCFSDRVQSIDVGARIVDDTLFGLPAVAFAPEVSLRLGPGRVPAGEQIELIAWIGSGPGRQGVSLVVDLATGVTVTLRTDGGAETGDPAAVALALLSDLAVPLLGSVVLNLDGVVDLLAIEVGGSELGEVLDGVIVSRSGSGSGVTYGLATDLLDVDELPGRIFNGAIAALDAALGSGIDVGPLRLDLAQRTAAGRRFVGIGLTLPPGDELELLDTGDLRLAIEVDDRWVAEAHAARGAAGAPPSGVELELLSVATSGDPRARIDPSFTIAGVGLRVSSPSDDRLIDLGVTLRSFAAHALVEVSSDGIAGGGHIELDGLALPVGSADGNPVAASLLGPDNTGGDDEPLAATFSPGIALVSNSGGDPLVIFRAGPGDGPWWLPVQRAFGPLYVDQIGVGRNVDGDGSTTAISLLLDGGASLAGLTVAVDDLSVTMPIASLADPRTWSLDLAGLAIGYQGGGVSMTGGLRKRDVSGAPDYVGMLQVRFAQYGITALGAYGVFPIPGSDETYSSMFLFGALRAPIGGPPAFFLTGIGAGAGINRRLIAPTDIDDVPRFPLVDALLPDSSFASDPMGALERLGETFPPERGALWFAAGVTFTSFALVETTALLTVEIHDGLEINLLGLARMALPTPAAPVAQVELALQARFSSREGVLSVIAHLTDNSWLINESCRLTGGFAFVVWFGTGEFVLTLGGYHPRFDKPTAFPDIDRLGFSWEPGGGIVVKGGAYFALTSGAVMTGGEIEVSYRKGVAWASLSAGVNILVEWDPLYYDIEVWIQITAGLKMRVCFFVCGTVRLSFDFGVHLRIVGPKLRGTATLDLSLITVTVRFGPSSSGNIDVLSWGAFRDKYVLGPSGDGYVSTTVVGDGLRTAEQVPGTDEDPDGSSARPWLVDPEFSLTVTTRAATNRLRGVTSEILDAYPIGPMGTTMAASDFVVRLHDASGADLTSRTRRTAMRGQVPGAVWNKQAEAEPTNAPDMVPSFTGVSIEVRVAEPSNGIVVEIEQVDTNGPIHPLPFAAARAAGLSSGILSKLRAEVLTLDHTSVDELFVAAGRLWSGLTMGERLSPPRRANVDAVTAHLRATRDAPPRLRSLADGIADTSTAIPSTKPVAARPDGSTAERPLEPPRLRATVEFSAAVSSASPPSGAVAAKAPRVAAPTLDGVARSVGAPLGASIRWTSSVAERAGSGRTREYHRGFGLTDGLEAEVVERSLRSGAGLTVGGARAQVWKLPGRGRVDEAQGVLTVKRSAAGDDVSVRVVALDPTGAPLVDRIATHADSVEVPSIGGRLVTISGARANAAFSGWLPSTEALQLGNEALVVPGAIVRARMNEPKRGAMTVDATAVRPAAVLRDDVAIETHLAAGTTTVVIGLDDIDAATPTGAAGGVPGGVLITGAQRVTDADGKPVPPVVVDEGDRRWIVVSLVRGDQPVVVGVAPSPSERLVGVVGSTMAAGRVAADLSAHGAISITPSPLTASAAPARIGWKG